MKKFNAQTLLEFLQNAKFLKKIPKSKDHIFKDPIKFLDSQRDKDYFESVADIDLKYESHGGVGSSILHFTSFIIINPGTKDESKEDIEFYIYKYGYIYRIDKTLEKKD